MTEAMRTPSRSADSPAACAQRPGGVDRAPLRWTPGPDELRLPSDDDEPTPKTTRQSVTIFYCFNCLRSHWRGQRDVFVGADQFIHRVPDYDPKTNPDKPPIAPDVYVAFGVANRHRGSYVPWEEGKVPGLRDGGGGAVEPGTGRRGKTGHLRGDGRAGVLPVRPGRLPGSALVGLRALRREVQAAAQGGVAERHIRRSQQGARTMPLPRAARAGTDGRHTALVRPGHRRVHAHQLGTGRAQTPVGRGQATSGGGKGEVGGREGEVGGREGEVGGGKNEAGGREGEAGGRDGGAGGRDGEAGVRGRGGANTNKGGRAWKHWPRSCAAIDRGPAARDADGFRVPAEFAPGPRSVP